MFQIKSSGDVLNSLAILLSITGIACQDETVYSYIGCSTVLPPTNDPSDLEGDDQIWYKGGVDTSDIILGYTVSTDSTVNGPAYDVNYSLNNTTAGLIIKEVVAENDDTYYFTQGFHAFEVYLDILDLESVWVNRINVTVNNVTVETPERVSVNVGDMAQLTARTGEVAHAGWPDIIHWTNATGDITESPGFKSFEAETSQLGTFYYSVQSEICNTTSEVYRVILDVEGSPTNGSLTLEITSTTESAINTDASTLAQSTDSEISTRANAQTDTSLSSSIDKGTTNADSAITLASTNSVETSTDKSSSTNTDASLPYSSAVFSGHFTTSGQTTESSNVFTSNTSETDLSDQGGSTSPGMKQVAVSSTAIMQDVDTTMTNSLFGTYTSRISGSTTTDVLSSTTLTQNESDHIAVLAVPGIVVFIGGVIALTVIFFAKLQGSGTVTHLSNMHSHFPDRNLQYNQHDRNGLEKWNYRNQPSLWFNNFYSRNIYVPQTGPSTKISSHNYFV